MRKAIIATLTLLVFLVASSTVLGGTKSFVIKGKSYTLTVEIENDLYSIKKCKTLMKYALMYIPPTWRTKVRKFIFTSHPRKHLYILWIHPCVLAEFIPFIDYIYYYGKLKTTSPRAFYSTVVHEYAHANGFARRLSKWRFLAQIYKRMYAPDRYKSSYAESQTRRLVKLEEFWAELAGECLTRPLYMKKKYPKDFALVQRMIRQTDPNFDITRNYKKIIKVFDSEIKKRISSSYVSGVIIKCDNKKITIKQRNGKTIVFALMPYSPPIIPVDELLPMAFGKCSAIIELKIWYGLSKVPTIGDTIVKVNKKIYLMRPLTKKRKSRLKK